MNSLEEKIEKLVNSCNVELYDIEWAKEGNKNIFRVYIFSKDGITLNKCEEVSNLISPLLDIQEPIKESYYLEVSSPGIERELKKLKHFESAVGELVRLKLLDGKKIEGRLIKIVEDELFLDVKSEIKSYKLKDLKSAKTIFKWK